MFNKIKNWFLHSETIFWARLQVAMGIIWAVVSVTDLSPLLTPKWLAIWGIVNGVVGEILRRRNNEVVTHMVPDSAANDAGVQVTTLVPTPITKVN